MFAPERGTARDEGDDYLFPMNTASMAGAVSAAAQPPPPAAPPAPAPQHIVPNGDEAKVVAMAPKDEAAAFEGHQLVMQREAVPAERKSGRRKSLQERVSKLGAEKMLKKHPQYRAVLTDLYLTEHQIGTKFYYIRRQLFELKKELV